MCRGVGRARRPTKPTTVPPPRGAGAASQYSNTPLPTVYPRAEAPRCLFCASLEGPRACNFSHIWVIGFRPAAFLHPELS